MEMNFAPKSTTGIATAGLVTGIVGAANALGGGGGGILGNLFGGNCNNWNGCGGNMPVSRYDLGKEQEIADLRSQLALRDSTIFTDQKSLEMYRYIDGKFNEVNAILGAQAVQNQATKDSFQLLQERLECECKARNAGDNSIVNYVNSVFYPKQISDLTIGTTSTEQATYNPLPVCGC